MKVFSDGLAILKEWEMIGIAIKRVYVGESSYILIRSTAEEVD